ncbi:MAG: guanylate kinase [Planctomycetota bacterium]|jgi:guanylate kinase
MSETLPGLVAVISGPSGVGKTTVISQLLERPGFARSITATTRPPREGEKDGEDYLFLDRMSFEDGITDGRFLEHAVVHGNLYGTPRDGVEAVLARGDVCLLNIDVQGADSLRQTGLSVATVFLLPPSMEELERRLGSRGTEDPDEMERRLGIARREMEVASLFDLQLENGEVAETVDKLESFLNSRRTSQ